ncbi:MAG: hypothetical protein LBI33_11795 [Propionibacteriaceae bacterium]|jgi:hypothetical protein|nr:hypothetical protein [Propionibacteriaceae bacterium]
MIIHKEDILETAADKAKTVAEAGSAAWEEVVERVTPLLETAAHKVGPVADDALEAAKEAKRRAAGFAADTVERFQPTVNSALTKVTPAVERAQRAVQDDLLPKLVRVLHEAAATPAGQEARELLAQLDESTGTSVETLKVELVKAKKSSKTKTIATLAAVGAVVGALAVAVRTFLGSREDWAAYEPDEPYVYPDDDYEIDGVLDEIDVVFEEPVVEAEAEPADETPEAAPAEAPSDEAPAEEGDASPFGEGSYAGPNPPEDYTIKGNTRSMKYHIAGSAGYARTTGDVWFASEEAAEAAGFVRSQR